MLQAASLFNQLLQHFSRTEFASLVKKHQAERAAKGFTCWTQFVAMTFCQLAHADSLREICNGLACSEGKLVHLGITNAPNKSTLSYANEHRPAELGPGEEVQAQRDRGGVQRQQVVFEPELGLAGAHALLASEAVQRGVEQG